MRNTIASNRSDAVRQRRRQHTQKRVAESSALASRPLAPITSRQALAPTAPHSGGRTNTRRQYQAALSMPGIEVRMPAISFTNAETKWRLISFALAALIGAAIYVAWSLPAFRMLPAQVTGAERLSAEDINASLGVTGEPVFTLVPRDLENRLRLTYPDLVSARVQVQLPNRLLVDVTERKPVILWQQNGAFTWIDQTGVAFRPRGAADGLISVQAAGSPPTGIVHGTDPLSPLPFISADLLQAIQTMAPNAPQGAAIVYDPRYGLGWADSRGWRAFFGTGARDMVLKLQVYQSTVAMLTSKGIAPALISVQYPSAPYYRMIQ